METLAMMFVCLPCYTHPRVRNHQMQLLVDPFLADDHSTHHDDCHFLLKTLVKPLAVDNIVVFALADPETCVDAHEPMAKESYLSSHSAVAFRWTSAVCHHYSDQHLYIHRVHNHSKLEFVVVRYFYCCNEMTTTMQIADARHNDCYYIHNWNQDIVFDSHCFWNHIMLLLDSLVEAEVYDAMMRDHPLVFLMIHPYPVLERHHKPISFFAKVMIFSK
mmetsp:Transcript_23905/g.35880  ORF Transcript_23905/g.35880 Transcript_23905/m.35880 type:complete len:218 (+) Transcript_23905:2501-3154(+)